MASPGDKFGHWTVLSTYFKRRGSKNRQRTISQCSCGKLKHHWTDNLMSGQSKSCGCQRRNRLTHGGTSGGPSPEYRAWQRMKQRCDYEGTLRYERWGGRGIKVCDRWHGSFPNFLADMGPKPGRGYSLERRDNDASYESDNCYWATGKQQSRNTYRSRKLTLNKQTLTVVEWSEVTGIGSTTIRARIDNYGWSIKKALTTPVR